MTSVNDVAWVAKYSPAGAVLWVARMDGSSNDAVRGCAFDRSGSLLVTGNWGYDSLSIFNSSNFAGPIPNAIIPNMGKTSAFLVKFSVNGLYQWSTRVDGNETEIGWALATDVDNSIIWGLTYSGLAAIFDSSGTPVVYPLSNSGITANNGAIVKYSSSGSLLWWATLEGSMADNINAVAVDPFGNVIAGGSYQNTAIFNTSVGSSAILPANSGNFAGGVIFKLTCNGTLAWYARADSINTDQITSVATDRRGDIVFSGNWNSGTLTFRSVDSSSRTMTNPNGNDEIFFGKISSSGVYMWIGRIGSSNTDIWSAVAVDQDDNIWVGGSIGDSPISIVDSSGTVAMATVAAQAVSLVARFSTNGTLQWVGKADSTLGDTTNFISLAVDSSRNLIWAHTYRSLMYFFDNCLNQRGTVLFSGPSYQGFLAKVRVGNYTLCHPTAQLRSSISYGNIIRDMAVYNSNSLIVGGSLGSLWLRMYNISSGALIRNIGSHTAQVLSVLIAGNTLYSGCSDSSARQTDLTNSSRTRIWTFGVTTNAVYATSDLVFLGASDGNIRITDPNSGALLGIFAYGNIVNALAGWNDRIYVGSVATSAVREYDFQGNWRQFNGHAAGVQALAVRGYYVYSTANDGAFGSTVRKFDVNTMATLWINSNNHISPGFATRLFATNMYLFSSGTDFTVIQYDANTGTIVGKFLGHTNIVNALVVDGPFLYSGSSDGFAFRWEIGMPYNQTIATSTFTRTSTTTSTRTLTSTFSTLNSTSLATVSTSTLTTATPSMTSVRTTSTAAQIQIQIISDVPQNSVSSSSSSAADGDLETKPTESSSSAVLVPTIAIITTLLFVGIVLVFLRIKVPSRMTSMIKANTITTDVTVQNSTLLQRQPGTSTDYTQNSLNTSIATVHELSVPAFLQKVYPLHFLIGKLIAKGGGGAIYEGQSYDWEISDRAAGNPIAIKVISQRMDKLSSQMQKSVWQEISLMWKFRDSPRFAKIYAYSMDPVCLVLKLYVLGDMSSYIHGANSQLSAKFPYTKRRMMSLMYQYCLGIQEMHDAGIAHCDIKPANVLLDVINNELLPVITDFGISTLLTNDAVNVAGFQVSEIKGASIHYASPDALHRLRTKNAVLDPRDIAASDIYALAITMLELLLRKTPWNGTKLINEYIMCVCNCS